MEIRPLAVDVAPMPGQMLHLRFADGREGTVDLSAWLRGRGGVFAPLHDPAFFARVTVDPESGAVTWPNGVDLDPDVIYEEAMGIGGGLHEAV
jgi:hypothetical protein